MKMKILCIVIAISASCFTQAHDETPIADPFDPASCPGTPLTQEGLKSLIPLPNTNGTKLGRFEVFVRSRTCYSSSQCTLWRNAFEKLAFYDSTQNGGYVASRSGEVAVELSSNVPQIVLSSDPFPESDGDRKWFINSTLEGSVLKSQSAGTANGHLSVGVRSIQSEIPLTGWVARNCFRQFTQASLSHQDNKGNDVVSYFEVVILSRFDH